MSFFFIKSTFKAKNKEKAIISRVFPHVFFNGRKFNRTKIFADFLQLEHILVPV